jgi:hypothetical protein
MTLIDGFMGDDTSVAPIDNGLTINGLPHVITAENANNGYVTDDWINYKNDVVKTYHYNTLSYVNVPHTELRQDVNSFFISSGAKQSILSQINTNLGKDYTVLDNFDAIFVERWETLAEEIATISATYKDNLANDLKILFRFTHASITTTVAYKFKIA